MGSNFNIINTSMIVVGAILIYCGVKNLTPKEALQQIISGSKTGTPVHHAATTPPAQHASPNPRIGGTGGGMGFRPVAE